MFPQSSANYLKALPLYKGRLFRSKFHLIKLRPFCIFPHLASRNEFERSKSSSKRTQLLNKNSRGKLEPIGFRETKSQKPIAHIFDGMTLTQLASAVNKDMDELGEHILEIGLRSEKYIEQPDEAMDRELLLEIIASLRMRPMVVAPPKIEHSDHSTPDLFPQPPLPKSEWQKRAPVVTIMGHVDHGKTTLLDTLRHSHIVAGEFGGITQHIGAFSVKLPDVGNEPVTFLDTPGHSAFKSMRERGAKATDIVVLVVAADDGVMEQTIESINYAKEAGVPIIVAVNKCDKPGVNPEKVLDDLLKNDIVPENYGGETQVVNISALYGRGIDKLQEAILLQSELMELHSTPKGPVEATIIESSKIQGLGIVCTLIVNRGTLRRGTVLVSGTTWGKVRSMTNEFNAVVKEAGPSTPVRIAGWRDELPMPGELALEAPNEGKAQSVVDYRKGKKQERIFTKEMQLIENKREEARRQYQMKRAENFQKGILAKIGDPPPAYTVKSEEEKAAAKLPLFSLIVKCDVDGTLEAIQDVLATYDAADQVRLDIVHSDVGPLSEPDLEMATEFNAHIFTFNAPIPARILELAKHKNIHVEEFHVIYKLVERLKELLSERIKPEMERHHLGEGTVLVEYRITEGMKKRQPIAGLRVDSGVMDKKAIWRITRIEHKKEGEESTGANESTAVVYEGPIESMQHEKKPINRATMEMEIGIAVEDKNVRYKEGDRVECFEDVAVHQKIGWNPPGF